MSNRFLLECITHQSFSEFDSQSYNHYQELEAIEQEKRSFTDEFDNNYENLIHFVQPLLIKFSSGFQINLDPIDENQFQNNEPFPNCLYKKESIFSIQKNSIHKKSKRTKFANKNFCRYILISAFNTLEYKNENIQQQIQQICQNHQVNIDKIDNFQVDYEVFLKYIQKNKNLITGVQVLKSYLLINAKNDSQIEQALKKTFQAYLIWYLENMAIRHMLMSKKKYEMKEYIRYKNMVMSFYVRYPLQWLGNKEANFRK